MWVVDVVFQLFGSSAYVDVVLQLIAGTAENLILIICSCDGFVNAQIIKNAEVAFAVYFIIVVYKVVRTEYFGELCCLLERIRCSEVYLCLSLCAAFCGNYHYTVGTACTVYGSRRSVLQYVYRFDFAWWYVTDAWNGKSVDDIKRWVVLWKWASTTDAYVHVSVGWAVGSGYADTGQFSGQRFRYTGYRYGSQVFSLYGCDRTGQVTFVYGSITDDHNFIQYFGIFIHDNVEVLLTIHLDFFGYITHIRKNQDGWLVNGW